MKKLKNILPIFFLLTVLSACNKDNPEVPQLQKTKLNFTYSDVCNNNFRTQSAIPNSGEPNLLVIPVYFSDSQQFIPTDKKSIVKEDINTAFFGTKEEVGYESVTSYYASLSYQKCKLKGTVTDWIDVEDSYLDYSIDERGTSVFCTEIVENYFSTTHDDRSKYDLDGNGYLDGVVLVYGAPDYDNLADGASTKSNLWAYTNWIDTKPNKESPVTCNFMWASYDFLYSKSTARKKIGTFYGSGDNTDSNLDTHIFIHETGHMFGLIDYYDYSYQYTPAGGFSMQDHNVGSHDPYSVMALGWCDPYIPTESCTITLNSFQSSRDCIILSNSWNELNSPFDEYLIVEYYTPDGLNEFDHNHQYLNLRPKGPNESGIRLWHVDARLLYSDYRDPSKVTCDPTTKNGKVTHMMSNTYYKSGGAGASYISPLGSSFANYNLLQLIRNEETETYQPHNQLDKYSLFMNGSKFSMAAFGKQFVKQSKLNSNKVLGWTFTVAIEENQAKITLTRTI